MTLTLKAGGDRNVHLDAAGTAAIIERWHSELAAQGSDATVGVLDISCRSWGDEAVDVLVPFVKEHCLDTPVLQFDDIIASRETSEGLSVIQKLSETFAQSNVRELYMSDNALGVRAMELLVPMFTNSAMEVFYVNNCGLDKQSMEVLKASMEANNTGETLRELSLDRNMIGVEGAAVVKAFLPLCKKLEYFSYAGCRPGEAGSKYICEGLNEMVVQTGRGSLRHLNLEDCTIGEDKDDSGVGPLSDALRKCSHLSYLSLKDGSMEKAGLRLIVDAVIASGAKLAHLFLDNNGELEEEGGQVIAELLKDQVPTLKSLGLEGNELGDDGVAAIMDVFQNSPSNIVEELTLTLNDIEEQGASAIVAVDFPNMKKLVLEDNDEIPKKALRKKFGNKVFFGEDDDDDSDDDDDDAVDELANAMDKVTV